MNGEKVWLSSTIANFGGIKVKLVFCEPLNKSKSLKPIILLSTNTDLTETRIVESYGQRWAVEVLFRESKQKLFFGKNSSRTFEATICFLTLSLVRFILVGYLERKREDYREKGSLFEKLRYEIEDLNMVAYAKHFLNLLFSLIKEDKETFALLINKLTAIQETMRVAIEAILFQRCET